MNNHKLWLMTLLAAGLAAGVALGQVPQAPPSPGPDSRYKVDILVVVAHPDDETVVGGYLARAIFDEHKRVAVVFGTRGDSGGNAMGYEQAAALGAEREIEARRALASFGVLDVWFLDGPDTAGQDVLRSLETWHHGEALARLVRIVRLTRPEVILTWLPDYVAGENHGDHQAAGVLATEAFDLAGNPVVFAEQVTPPRDRTTISNLTEGLRPWQPAKLYFFSDALHTDFLEGQGPKYSTLDTSPAKHVPYYRLAAEEMAYHLTQGDSGQMAKQALEKGDFRYFQQPVMLVFGKSLVHSSRTGDVFEGVTAEPVAASTLPAYQPETHQGVWIELGGPWAFYEKFWKAHGLEHLASLLPEREVSVPAGTALHVPILIHNDTGHAVEVTLSDTLPQGWKARSGAARYPVAAHDFYPVELTADAPAGVTTRPQEMGVEAESQGKSVGSLKLKLYTTEGGLPQ